MKKSQTSSPICLNFSSNFMFYVGKMASRSHMESPSNCRSPRQPAPRGLCPRAQTQLVSSLSHKLGIGKSVWHTKGVGNSSGGVRSWYFQPHQKHFIRHLSKTWATTPSRKLVARQLGQMSIKPNSGFPVPKFCDHQSWPILGEDLGCWQRPCCQRITCNGGSQVINGSVVQRENTGERQEAAREQLDSPAWCDGMAEKEIVNCTTDRQVKFSVFLLSPWFLLLLSWLLIPIIAACMFLRLNSSDVLTASCTYSSYTPPTTLGLVR